MRQLALPLHLQVVRTRWIVAILIGTCLTAGCGNPFDGGGDQNGPGRRSQQLALSPEQELQAGRQAYREVLAKDRGQILPADSPEVVRARQITTKILRAAAIKPLQKEINLRVGGYRFEWEVNVVRSKEINAFCLPGGKIVVFTGIMHFARSDDELAAVLAHEIAHALAHHASERVALEQRNGGSGLGGLRNDRMQESEADHIGLFLMTFAGYDPDAAVQFWERMQQIHRSGRVPELLSDHPSDEHRVQALREWTPKAKAALRAYQEGHIVTWNLRSVGNNHPSRETLQ